MDAIAQGDRAARVGLGGVMFARNAAVAAVVYCIAYVALNTLTSVHQFGETGITLWSPDNGLSVLLLLRSRRFLPVVVAASTGTDFLVNHVAQGFGVDLALNAASASVYACLAWFLSVRSKFDPAGENAGQVVAMLASVPIAAAASAIAASGLLYWAGDLTGLGFWSAARHYWIGDTVGMIVAIPGVAILLTIAREPARASPGLRGFLAVLAVAAALYGVTVTVVAGGQGRDMLYLLFLPIVWVGITFGYRAAAMAVLFAQLALIANIYERGIDDRAFGALQLFMLVLAATGLLLGGVASERTSANTLLLRQRRALERSSAQAALGAAAASIAHELSQPLASLAAYVHAARRLAKAGGERETIERALASAEGEAARARAILSRVRDFVADGTLHPETRDLAEIAEKIRGLNHAEARRRDVEIEVVADPAGGPCAARCDAVMAEQALNNLVVNAVESVAATGRPDGLVSIRLVSAEGRAGFDVVDNGPGVDPQIADTLFDAFETTKSSGMGLGLSLASQIMLKHGGRLDWSPVAPTGAKFSMRFPE